MGVSGSSGVRDSYFLWGENPGILTFGGPLADKKAGPFFGEGPPKRFGHFWAGFPSRG